MFPAQALAEAMLRKGWRVKLSTDDRGARYTGGFPHMTEIEQVPSATFARGGLSAKAQVPYRIASGVWRARKDMRRDRPEVVIGFGGYPSIPALAAATWLGLPRMIHEQNGVLGRVNRLFAPRVAKVACGIWPTDLPSGANGIHVGNPVRSAIAAQAGAAYTRPQPGKIRLLVMGGSQGARVLSDVVPGAIAALPEDLRAGVKVSHQARSEDQDRVVAFYAEHSVEAEVEPFFNDVPERMRDAQLVITRAGASTVADLTAIGRPSILVPFAAATGDHQTANARGLVEAEASVLVPEAKLDVAGLAGHIAAILNNPARAQTMATAAHGLARIDATERLVAMVEELSGKATV